MTTTKQRAAQVDYEVMGLTIADICQKYSCHEKELGGWSKGAGAIEELLVTEEPEAELVTDIIIVPEDVKDLEALTGQPPLSETEQDIKEYKGLVLKKALTYIKEQDDWIEVKDLKQMTDLVISIEASNTKNTTDTGPTINVLVQNITEKFKDDC